MRRPITCERTVEVISVLVPTSTSPLSRMLAAMRAGSVVLDCSTSDPSSTRRLAALAAERKVGYVDAGMTRGVAGAKQGTLAFFIGGVQEHIDRAMPALSAAVNSSSGMVVIRQG